MTESNTDRDQNKLEVLNTIMLGIATLAVAWCSYQGALWNGIQTFRLAESNKYGRLAQQRVIQTGQTKAMEEAVIITFVNAALEKDTSKLNYILNGVDRNCLVYYQAGGNRILFQKDRLLIRW